MQRPELEEEALRLVVHGKDLTVERDHGRHGGAGDVPRRPARPPLTLGAGEPGLWLDRDGSELGRQWRATKQQLTALINVGQPAREFAEVT
jgi:hypothetical protein